MYIFSRCFLNCGSWLNIFSIIVISMSLVQCPLELKCAPVDFDMFLVFTYPLCSENLSLSILSLSPIYCWGHFLQPNKYIILLVEQSTLEFISILKFVAVALTVLVCLIYGQTLQLLHFFMPWMSLFGLPVFKGGNFDLISLIYIIVSQVSIGKVSASKIDKQSGNHVGINQAPYSSFTNV